MFVAIGFALASGHRVELAQLRSGSLEDELIDMELNRLGYVSTHSRPNFWQNTAHRLECPPLHSDGAPMSRKVEDANFDHDPISHL